MLRRLTRGGVPVLNRRRGRPRASRLSVRGGVKSVGAGFLHAVADDGAAPEIGAGAQHHRPDPVYRPGAQHHAGDAAGFRPQGHRLRLAQGQVLLPLQGVLHHLLIGPAVRLGPQGPHGGTLPAVEHPILDADPVRRPGHFAAQGVQLPDQVTLGGAADGGVAGHIAHGVQVDGQAHRFQPQAGGGQSRLDAGVSRADDGDIKLSHTGSLCAPQGQHRHLRAVEQAHHAAEAPGDKYLRAPAGVKSVGIGGQQRRRHCRGHGHGHSGR